jgi:hypothetical protein
MLETSIAYLLSMEWGRDITVPPSSSFSVKSDSGPDVTFFVMQAKLDDGVIRFVPMSTKCEFVVLFIWGKNGDNCVTIPTAKVQDELPTGVLTPKKVAESLIHKIKINVDSDFLPSGNDFIYQRQAKA